MRTEKTGYLAESKLVVRQGLQLWHLHQALKEKPEQDVLLELAHGYVEAGRASSLAEGMVTAAGIITAYRSTESGERVPQEARQRLKRPASAPVLA